MSGVYFGNKQEQVWLKAPKTGLQVQSEGWTSESKYLNGTASIRRSRASHRRYSPSWFGFMNSEDGSSIYTIKDFADGTYGDGPFYFVDPYAIDENVMPAHWAAPHLTEKDWPSLVDANVVTAFEDYTYSNNYPSRHPVYTITSGYASTKKLTLIIPKGYKLHFGWHGTADSSSTGVRVVPYLRSTGEADTALNPLKITAGGSIRTNTRVSGTTYSHVEIFLASSANIQLELVAMIAQILPDSSMVESGGFITGRGNTGIEFATFPQIEYYSAAIGDGLIGLSCDWVEVNGN